MDFLMQVEDLKAYLKKGKAIVYNVDCRDILKKCDDESVDLFVSDIPYKINKSGGGIKKERKKICWRYV